MMASLSRIGRLLSTGIFCGGIACAQFGAVSIEGVVVLDDGSPAAKVEVRAGQSVTYSDKKGRFLISPMSSVGATSLSRPDLVGVAPNREPARPGSTRIWFRLAGYEDAALDADSGTPRGYTVMLHRRGGAVGNFISITTSQAPRDALQLYRRGLDASQKGKPADAEAAFRKAIEIYPRFAAAWVELAKVQIDRGNTAEARQSLDQSLLADRGYGAAYALRAELAWQARDWQNLAEAAGQALHYGAATFPREWFYAGIAQFALNDADAAEKSWRKAAGLDTRGELPLVHQYLATVLAKKNDWAGAIAEMREYLKLAPTANDAAAMRARLAEWEAAMAKQP